VLGGCECLGCLQQLLSMTGQNPSLLPALLLLPR
jgi:hypothetical protein